MLCPGSGRVASDLAQDLFQDRVGQWRPPAVSVNRINVQEPSRSPDLTQATQRFFSLPFASELPACLDLAAEF